MTAVATGSPLASDRALPQRDVLLDPGAVAQRLGQLAAGGAVVGSCRLQRAKYRVGQSLRVVYEVDVDGSTHVVAGRMSASGSDTMFRSAAQHRLDVGWLGGVFHDAELETVWWTFPNDRKLRHLAALVAAPPAHGASDGPRWTRSELVAYAPEHCATLRCLDERDGVVGYAKAYRAGTRAHLPAHYRAVNRGLLGSSATLTPRPLAWFADLGVLVLEAIPGQRWADLGRAELPALLRGLGRALATFHRLEPRGVPRFARLQVERLAQALQVVTMARPDLADLCAALTTRLSNGPPPSDGRDVLLHGDVHPGNALLDGTRVNLIDLDQSGVGSAATDIGSVAARLRYYEIIGAAPGWDGSEMLTTFADGYASVRPLPGAAVLRWHTAAALVAERAIRAVSRVNRQALPKLPEVLAEALDLLQRGSSDGP